MGRRGVHAWYYMSCAVVYQHANSELQYGECVQVPLICISVWCHALMRIAMTFKLDLPCPLYLSSEKTCSSSDEHDLAGFVYIKCWWGFFWRMYTYVVSCRCILFTYGKSCCSDCVFIRTYICLICLIICVAIRHQRINIVVL